MNGYTNYTSGEYPYYNIQRAHSVVSPPTFNQMSNHITTKMNYEAMLNSGVNLVYGTSGRDEGIKILEFNKFIKVDDKY